MDEAKADGKPLNRVSDAFGAPEDEHQKIVRETRSSASEFLLPS